MYGDIFGEISHLVTSILDAFRNASPLANAITTLTPVCAVSFSMRRYLRWRDENKDTKILQLEKDVVSRNETIYTLGTTVKQLEARCAEAENQLPQMALDKSDADWRENNDLPANRTIVTWFENQGPIVSELLLRRAQWAVAHAAGDVRVKGLVAAQGFAIAAVTVNPRNRDAVFLLEEAEKFLDEVEQPVPTLTQAFSGLDDSQEWFDTDLVKGAEALMAEAYLRHDRGFYHLALPPAEQAAVWLMQSLGRRAPTTLRVQYFKAYLLLCLGRYQEALEMARAVLKDMEQNPALGPSHPDTLNSRYLVANILGALGHYEEALEMARAVLKDREQNPALGPNHPDTLNSRYLVANILELQGRYEEALEMARAVLKDREQNPALGPSHPDTLRSRQLVADILKSQGRYEEALEMARAVLKDREQNPALGPNHPDILRSRHLVADILKLQGRYEEALEMARGVAKDMEQNQALGPNHPDTLRSRQLVADIVKLQGRYEEALEMARGVAKDMEQNPALGPNHPDTLRSRQLVADILKLLGH
jgi:tetratricopeptide (TPR) repeat protein